MGWKEKEKGEGGRMKIMNVSRVDKRRGRRTWQEKMDRG